MQPLKSLTFVRIGNANSHKYSVNKKQLRSFKTVCNKINSSWKDYGIDYNIQHWNDDVYNKHWSYKKRVEYYKGKVAPQHLIDYKDKQEELIDSWKEHNKDLLEVFNRYKRYIGFNKDGYHGPPQLRGLYAFPQYRLETFLTHWDDSKFNIKVKKDGTCYKMRAKNYAVIKYNKPTLWCHFIDEAIELEVDIKVNKGWVLVNSCDYLNVLTVWEKRRLREHRNDMRKYKLNIKHCYKFGSKDDLEVFLVGV